MLTPEQRVQVERLLREAGQFAAFEVALIGVGAIAGALVGTAISGITYATQRLTRKVA